MLQNIRDNSQGWIAKTIIGLIVVLLAFTGFEAIFNTVGNAQNAAEVNGEEISLSELNQAVDMQRRQLLQQFGRDFDTSLIDDRLLRDAALRGLIEQRQLLGAAEQAGFAFPEAALDQVILLTPEFQQNGQFSPERFDQVIRQMGYTRLQFREMLRQEMLLGQLRAGIAGSGFVTEREVEAFARLERQTRDFATLVLKVEPTAVSLGEDEVQAYYNDNAARFMSPEQVVIDYVELKKDQFFAQVEVSEADLRELYEKEIANLAEQRQAAHILVESGDVRSDAEAKAKIEEIRQRLSQGEEFTALAKQLSEDPASAADGGDLGFAGPGVYDPAFEEALYALKKGEVSAPVRSDFGWHLIKLLNVQSADVPSLASLKDKLERDLKTRQVEQRFVEASKQLEDAAFEASDLAQPAQELGLTVQTSEPFGREGGEGLSANRQIVQAAFSPEVLEEGSNSAALELDPETVVVLRVREHRKAERLPFEQVAGEIRQQLRQERAAGAVQEKGERLLADLRQGKTPVELAGAAQTWKVVEAANRAQEGVEPVVLQTLFRMPKPEAADKPQYAGVTLPGGDYALVRLSGVSEPKGGLPAAEKAMYQRFLASRSGQQDFAAYRAQLEAEAKIKRF